MNMKKNKLNHSTRVHVLGVPDNAMLIASAKMLLGIFALFASAQIQIPIKPVPITLQTIVISIIGLSYNPRLSFITLSSYLTLGTLGAPMFIKYSGGLNHLTGVTAGYLLGFLLAAPIISYLKTSFSGKFFGVMLCCLIGHAIIYILGIAWLANFIGFEKALYSGFLIYIPSGIVKISVLSCLYSYINSK